MQSQYQKRQLVLPQRRSSHRMGQASYFFFLGTPSAARGARRPKRPSSPLSLSASISDLVRAFYSSQMVLRPSSSTQGQIPSVSVELATTRRFKSTISSRGRGDRLSLPRPPHSMGTEPSRLQRRARAKRKTTLKVPRPWTWTELPQEKPLVQLPRRCLSLLRPPFVHLPTSLRHLSSFPQVSD